MTEPATPSPASFEAIRTPKKAAIAAWIGSALEYYDFFIYGTAAALVFPDIFFPEGNPHAATIASLATFGVAYVARPIGSFLMGHIGDRLGRKRVLIGTLLLMGISTFLVGCLPTYSQIGLLAPALLVALRLLQGLSASGEQAAPTRCRSSTRDERRGFITSWTLSGTQGGQVIAPAIFLPLAAVLSDDQLKAGAGASRSGSAPPWSRSATTSAARSTRPRPSRRRRRATSRRSAPLARAVPLPLDSVLRVFFAAFIASVNTIFGVFALSSRPATTTGSASVDDHAVDRDRGERLRDRASSRSWATLSDRVGRKPVFVQGWREPR